jgi:hypothetical protein
VVKQNSENGNVISTIEFAVTSNKFHFMAPSLDAFLTSQKRFLNINDLITLNMIGNLTTRFLALEIQVYGFSNSIYIRNST